jgi:ABC-type transport system involved in cytochrome c biogenesis permease subunit
MTTNFQSLITTICVSVIIRELCEMIIPSGKIYSFVSMALGLITSFVIVQKIIETINVIL